MEITIQIDDARGSRRLDKVKVGAEGVTFGRSGSGYSRNSFVEIFDVQCSQQHLIVEVDNGAVAIRDLDSKNGTKLGNIRLDPGKAEKWDRRQVVEIGKQARIKLVEIGCGGEGCPLCGRDLANFSLLEKQLHVNECAESTTAPTGNSKQNNRCMVCLSGLDHLTSIQATNHINRCLDGENPPSAEAKPKRAKPTTTAVTTRKRKTTTSASVFTFTKRTSLTQELIGQEDDQEVFELECKPNLLPPRTAVTGEEDNEMFEPPANRSTRAFLCNKLERQELLRRRQYFEKQLRYCDELLLGLPVTGATVPNEEDSLPPIDFCSTLQAEATLQRLDAICAQSPQQERDRVNKLTI
ncbi:hypothetical protein BASA81_008679 [Batrachochytrium salamandrivorans]|nr:hypothetical protein BASA81_008679 [Batrachochytrium salamandrivorans]